MTGEQNSEQQLDDEQHVTLASDSIQTWTWQPRGCENRKWCDFELKIREADSRTAQETALFSSSFE